MSSVPVEPSSGPVPVSASHRPPVPTGLVLSPFRALRYDPALAGELSRLSSPPYDVLDAGDVTELEAASDYNVVRVILPRQGPGGQDRYRHAAELIERWRAAGVLRPDPTPALYVYEQADPTTGGAQRGLVGALGLSPAEDGIVLPHENTMAGPVTDRLALYTAVEADLEPIFLLYDGGGAASQAVAAVDALTPLVDTILPDGLRHRLWSLTDPGQLADIAADLLPRRAVIADGHHRYATYLRRQAERHAAGAGPGPWDAGLTLLVDSSRFGPQVHAIHRVLPGQPAADLAARAAAGIRVEELPAQPTERLLATLADAGRHGPAFVLASGQQDGRCWLLTDPDPAQLSAALPADRSPATRALDIIVLHTYLIGALWGLADGEETVGYQHEVDAAWAAAQRTGGSAVLLNPTPVAAVVAVAAAGERMPRKSTLFTPKPRSGLLIRTYRDNVERAR